MHATEVFARYAAEFRSQPLRKDVLHHAKRAVIDWYASLFPGLGTAPVQLLERTLADDLDHGSALLPQGRRATARAAALLNGTAAHAAEVDDSFRDAMYHPGAATIAAALAAYQDVGASGLQFLRGVVLGYEISTRIGVVMGRPHYRFWHSTGTVGSFGAAAAAGELLGLTRQRSRTRWLRQPPSRPAYSRLSEWTRCPSRYMPAVRRKLACWRRNSPVTA